jgi:hypothetical protein
MTLKIRGLEHSNPKEAAKSVLKMERMSTPDKAKLRDAEIMGHIARVAARRASAPEERAGFKGAASVYLTYVLKLKKRIKSSKG